MRDALTYYRLSSHPDAEPVQFPPDVDWDAFPEYVPTDEDLEAMYHAHLAEQRALHPEVTEEE